MPKFDAAAENYDNDFTHSIIGKAQRDAVYAYLEKHLPKRPINILELNGGTGEDAVWLAKKNHRVVCTDVSESMLDVAKRKAQEQGVQNLLQFESLDLSKPDQFKPPYQFDLVFSNFAGLNCLHRDELSKLFTQAKDWLVPGGELILVFLSKYCLWEWLYFFGKGKFKKAERRWTKDPVVVNVDGSDVPTYYYSVSEVENIASWHYNTVGSKAIGTAVPPSYLNSWFNKYPSWIKGLKTIDEDFGSSSFFADISDHFLIHLKKK